MTRPDKKLNIGILSFYPPSYGGVTTLVVGLASYYAQKGHNVHVVGFKSDINPPELDELGVKLHQAAERNIPDSPISLCSWTLASKLYQVHNEVGLDVVNAHYGMPYGGSVIDARKLIDQLGGRKPVFKAVITGHGSDIHTLGRDPDLNPMMRYVLENADAVSYVGNGLKEIAEKPIDRGGLGSEKSGVVIPNFVQRDIFYPEENNLRQELKIPRNSFVVVHGSNFEPVKQTDHFYDVANYLRQIDQLKSIFFIMCGEGKYKDALEARVISSGLEKHFRFLGRQDLNQMRRAYNAGDVSALTSKNEGCPLAVIESMACGTPVIGTRVQGISWLIDEEKTGFLFDQHDIRAFANLLIELKSTKHRLKPMKQHSIRKIDTDHTIDIIANKYLDLYYGVINQK